MKQPSQPSKKLMRQVLPRKFLKMLATSAKQFTTILATPNKKLKKMLSTCKLPPTTQILKKKLRKMFHMQEALSMVLVKACGKKLQQQESSLLSRINRKKIRRKKKKNKKINKLIHLSSSQNLRIKQNEDFIIRNINDYCNQNLYYIIIITCL